MYLTSGLAFSSSSHLLLRGEVVTPARGTSLLAQTRPRHCPNGCRQLGVFLVIVGDVVVAHSLGAHKSSLVSYTLVCECLSSIVLGSSTLAARLSTKALIS